MLPSLCSLQDSLLEAIHKLRVSAPQLESQFELDRAYETLLVNLIQKVLAQAGRATAAHAVLQRV